MLKQANEIRKGERFYKIIVSCPVNTDTGKYILKVTGVINKKDQLRCIIVFDYEDGHKRFCSIPKISKEDFDDKIIGEMIPKALEEGFDIPEDHFKVLDLSDIDNIDDQLKKMKEIGAGGSYSPEEFKDKYSEMQRQKFSSEILN